MYICNSSHVTKHLLFALAKLLLFHGLIWIIFYVYITFHINFLKPFKHDINCDNDSIIKPTELTLNEPNENRLMHRLLTGTLLQAVIYSLAYRLHNYDKLTTHNSRIRRINEWVLSTKERCIKRLIWSLYIIPPSFLGPATVAWTLCPCLFLPRYTERTARLPRSEVLYYIT